MTMRALPRRRRPRLPGPGSATHLLGGAPLVTRVSTLFSTGEPIQHGTNYAPVDVYTPAHAAAGALLGFGRAPWWAALAVAAGWGTVAYVVQKIWPSPVPATAVQNAVVDSAAMLVGWGAAKAWIETKVDDGTTTEETVVAPEPEAPARRRR